MKEIIEQKQKTQGGIYAILNKHTDRIYIGQAINFSKRWKAHQNSLLRNKHNNKFLQNDFNKCFKELGNTDFLEFSVIEIVEDIKDKDLLAEREQVYLDAFIPEGSCYNIVKKARIENSSCFSKTPEETRKKMSESQKKKWKKPGYREKMSKSQKKMWENSENIKKRTEAIKKAYENPENIKKLSNAAKKIWENKLSALRAIVISPDGKEFEVYNITKFAIENNLNPKNLNSLINGKNKSHKGWTLKK